ncbi:hypothetical protein EOD42_08915 [Rhodovarius crocodyli]|uniref:Uncharacterized protein n=1 Tax=Rhodovarius crocodyli TaxID=1979269 RepID=A0A437MJS8_9PROT|nr:hypothetical protein [Rhodovarius crocodyli]RVT97901.1 hypothetical protein EOD42_08915 [Rhodovarius crocodyli]
MSDAFAAAARALHRDPNASVEAWYTAAPGRSSVPSGEQPLRVTRTAPTEGYSLPGASRKASTDPRHVTLCLADLPYEPLAGDVLRIGTEISKVAVVEIDAERTQATITLSK